MANPIKVIKGIKKVTKTPGVKGRGTKSTSISAPKSNVKVVKSTKQEADMRRKAYFKKMGIDK